MDQKDLDIIQEKVGKEARTAIEKALKDYDEKAKEFANAAAKGKISEEVFKEFSNEQEKAIGKLTDILEKQGLTITELGLKLEQAKAAGAKSIAQVLAEDEAELKKVYEQGSGNKQYMLMMNEKGEFVMKPHSTTQKTVGPVATISGINGGTAASIFQSIDAASLLRLGGDSAIISQYRNNTWLFDLVNVVNAGWDNMMAMWFEEVAKTGTSATVAEGATKPLVQYGYTLKTATYKKEAMLIGFTEEFSLDFARLQSDILGKGRVDVMNRINTQLVTDLLAAATAYNTGTAYKGSGGALTQYNDYLAIDAAAAQVDASTFGGKSNAAIMNTYKYHRINTQMDTQGRFLMPPAALNGITQIGNPGMASDDLIVGDLKQFNLILRGGLIVRVGYNGTDFAQNMFSTVIEQYYYDYISAIRAVAIVKGQTFAAIKTAITT